MLATSKHANLEVYSWRSRAVSNQKSLSNFKAATPMPMSFSLCLPMSTPAAADPWSCHYGWCNRLMYPPCGCSSTLRWPERSGEPQRDHSMTAVGHKDGHDVRPWDSYGTRPLGDSLWSCGSSLVGCKTSGSWSWDSCGSMGLRTAVS